MLHYLLNLFTFSGVYAAFCIAFLCTFANIRTQKRFLRKSSETFDTEIVGKTKKVKCWAKKLSYKKTCS